MRLEVIRRVAGLQVHYADGRNCMASTAATLQTSSNRGCDWSFLCRLPGSLPGSLLHRFSPYRRLMRRGVHAVHAARRKDDLGWIVVADKKLYWVTHDGRRFEILFRIPRGHRPLGRGLAIVGRSLFLGEYWGNPGREPVRIHRVDLDTGQAEVFYEFSPHTVRHIHVVDYDPYSDALWIATGDEDRECMIGILDQRTGRLQPIGSGSQQWRTVSFAFWPEAVYWGTDDPLGKNEIWRFERRTGAISAEGGVVGPVYYSTYLASHTIFGTTVERGGGQQDGYGRLYACDRQGRVEEIWKKKKDRLPKPWFGNGVFQFAGGQSGDNRFWVTATGFEGGLHSQLFELKGEDG